jgi:hypothetical protein
MSTFAEFLVNASQKGELVNTLFEERLFGLVSVLHRITAALAEDGLAYELIGGLAVLVHVEEVDPSQAMLTRDVDLMVQRGDLTRIQAAAKRVGFRFRHVAGVDMLLFGETDSARNAVHLIFSGEKVRPTQAVPNPGIAPERKTIHGKEVFVVPVADLLKMKLSSFRLKDQVHVQVLDSVGLIGPEAEAELPPELTARLRQVRESE